MLADRSERIVDEPVLEAGGQHRRSGGGNEGAVVEYDAEVARLRIRDDPAGVVLHAETGADEVVERIPVWAGDLADATDWLTDRGAGDSTTFMMNLQLPCPRRTVEVRLAVAKAGWTLGSS